MYLRRRHPNFWLVVASEIVGFAWIGATWMSDPARWAASAAFDPARTLFDPIGGMRFLGAVFLSIALGLAFGIYRMWRLAEWAFIAATGVVAFLASTFVLAMLAGKPIGSAGPALLMMIAAQLYAQSGEPPSNPANVGGGED